jgi:CRISPR/Cas system endoribonuclease Cas6 (RAMP superfamily)
VEAEMTILGQTKTRPILVVKGHSTTEAILGYNFIKQEGLVVDRARNEVYFSKEVPHAAAWSIAVRASKEMTLEPRSVHKVQENPFVGRQMLQPN